MKPFLLKHKCAVQRDICPPIKVCPTAAISYQDNKNEPLGGEILFNLEKCNECGKCAIECCGQAIEMR